MCSRSPKNLEFCHDNKEMHKNIVLWRSCCRRRRRSAKFLYLVSDDDNGDGSENVTIKMKSRFVKRRCYYSNLQGKFPLVE